MQQRGQLGNASHGDGGDGRSRDHAHDRGCDRDRGHGHDCARGHASGRDRDHGVRCTAPARPRSPLRTLRRGHGDGRHRTHRPLA
ncbi:hypothetical protein ABTL38_19515, partial [Acinetobacter baumannii]